MRGNAEIRRIPTELSRTIRPVTLRLSPSGLKSTGAGASSASRDGNMATASKGANRIIHFSLFELDLAAGELRRNGAKVRLQEQPLQILITLLERPGELVRREELRAKLWPADTFVDFDHGLNAAVRRLRDALGDSAETPDSLKPWRAADTVSSGRFRA
jgi:DNA-binding response OmpR family regulator